MGTKGRTCAASIPEAAVWAWRFLALLAALVLFATMRDVARAQPKERSGEEVVAAQCAKCHATGENGAPRIGDKSAWTPRLSHGVDVALRAAIAGHGAMPARGGMADLTDGEVRRAIIYMFNPVSAVTVAAKGASTPPRAPGGNRKVVSGVEIDVGLVPAESLRMQSAADGKQSPMGGGAPHGKGYVHLNVSLFDSRTSAAIVDADVRATIKDPVKGAETRELQTMVINGVTSYGSYFRAPGTNPYKVDIEVRRKDAPFVETVFDFRR